MSFPDIPAGKGIPLVDMTTKLFPAPTMDALDGRYGLVTTPEAFGAVGDGTTDDTAAFQAAVDAVEDAGRGTVRLAPGATYLVESIDIQQGLTIEGYGATLKRPAAMPNGTRTLTNQNRIPASSAVDALPITLLGVTIDGNLANQGTYSGYELEQAMLVMVVGGAGGGRLPFVARDVTVKNSPSDGIHIQINVAATISNLTAVDCFRGGLVVSGGYSTVVCTGYRGSGAVVGAHIDIEVDTDGHGTTKRCDLALRDAVILKESGASTKQMDISALGGAVVTLDSVTAESGFCFVAPEGKLTVRDSELHAFQGTFENEVIAPTDVTFDRTTFVVHASSGTPGEIEAVLLTMTLGGFADVGRHLLFRDCQWVLGTVNASDTPIGVRLSATTYAHGDVVTVTGGSFATDYAKGVWVTSGGRLVVNGGTVFGSDLAIHAAHSVPSGREYELTIGQVVLTSTNITYLFLENSDAACIVRHDDTVMTTADNVLSTISGLNAATTYGRRVIMLAAAPTGSTHGLKGDVARLITPVSGAAYEWVCTTGGDWTAQVWKQSAALA